MGKKIAILYSGGLDSFTMHHMAKVFEKDAEIKLFYVAHGTESEDAEIALLPEGTTVINVDWLGKNGVTPLPKPGQENAGNFYIPGRNMVMISLIACEFLPDEIWLGPTNAEIHETAYDKNLKFKDMLQETLRYVLTPYKPNVKIRYPLVEQDWDKDDQIRFLVENGITAQEISDKTSSCWHNNGKQCGDCWMCLRRFFYFHKAIGECTDTYATDLLTSNTATTIFSEYSMLNKNNLNEDQQSFYDAVREYEAKHNVRLIK